MKKTVNVKYLSRLALFLALGIILNIFESMIPLPIPIPGVRLGIANVVGLILLYYYGIKEFLIIGFLRVLLVGLLRTGLFSIPFSLSLAGYCLSSLIVIIIYMFKKASIYGLSIASSLMHSLGQILVVLIIYDQVGLFYYLPFLSLSSVISGGLISIITATLLTKLNKHISFIAYR